MDTSIIYHEWDPKIQIKAQEIESRLLQETSQIPPIYSALRIHGERAYIRARSGENPLMPKRPILVSEAKILNICLPKITLHMRISSGGYIRSFAPLLGKWYQTSGGYITSLRRTALHLPYGKTLCISDAQHLDTFDSKKNLPLTTLFEKFSHVCIIDPILESAIRHGKSISVDTFEHKNEPHILAQLPDGSYSLLIQSSE